MERINTTISTKTKNQMAALAAHWGYSPVRHISQVIRRVVEDAFVEELSDSAMLDQVAELEGRILQESDKQGVASSK